MIGVAFKRKMIKALSDLDSNFVHRVYSYKAYTSVLYIKFATNFCAYLLLYFEEVKKK